jgi:hypothetical protein
MSTCFSVILNGIYTDESILSVATSTFEVPQKKATEAALFKRK